MRASTLNTWVIALLRTLDSRSIDSRSLAIAAGLDPDQINEPNSRSPVVATSKLWRLAVEATGDPCLGLKVVTYVQPATFHSLGFALMASDNLEDVLQRTARFSGIVSNALEFDIARDVGGVRQIVRWCAEVPTVDETIDLMMASTIKLGMLMLGIDAKAPRPIALRLCRAATPAMRREFEDYFRCPVEFEAPENSLWIPEAWLARPLPMANPALARQSDLVVMAYLSRFDRNTLADQVRAELISRLPAGEPPRSRIALVLGMSEKALQRRLCDERTRYQDILDEVRRELAQRYLHERTISLSDISFRLGFADQSAFNRAFRRWRGMTPMEYRNAAAEGLSESRLPAA